MSKHRRTKAHRKVEQLNNPRTQFKDTPETIPTSSEPRAWDIWSEGIRCTGQDSPAQLMDTIVAPTFNEAVAIYAEKCYPNKKERDGWFNFRDGNWSFWGCRLYDNEEDARKFNG